MATNTPVAVSMDDAIKVKPRELRVLLLAAYEARLPVLITGAPGGGKTSIFTQTAAELGFDLVLEHPAVSDPVDYKGFPMPPAPGENVARFVPLGNLGKILNATRPTVWAFDDLGQAPPSVQAACMQVFLAREINGHKIPDCVTFVAATNRRIDRAGVSGILEPVKSRFVTIVELIDDLDDWCKWAMQAGISVKLIAFQRFRGKNNDGGLLSKFTPTADLTNSPLPRTWENLSKLEALKLPQVLEAKTFAGAVGAAAANEYLTFRKLYASLASIDHILMDPKKAKLPTRVDELYAVTVGLAARAEVGNFDRIATYANRLITEANNGEFAALLVRDSVRKNEDIISTDAYIALQTGPLGQLLSGNEG